MAAVANYKGTVREKPSLVPPRVALFQLSAFLGDWEQCAFQADEIISLGGDAPLWLGLITNLQASKARAACWAGQQSPLMVTGANEVAKARLASLWQAVTALAAGDPAPLEICYGEYGDFGVGPGELDGKAFTKLGGFDSRLPGVLEIAERGTYAWLALEAIEQLELPGGPTNLSDVLWLPGRVSLTSGEVKVVAVFGLYPGTEQSADPMVLLGQVCDWDAAYEQLALGLGGQLLDVDGEPVPLVNIRQLVMDFTPAAADSSSDPSE